MLDCTLIYLALGTHLETPGVGLSVVDEVIWPFVGEEEGLAVGDSVFLIE